MKRKRILWVILLSVVLCPIIAWAQAPKKELAVVFTHDLHSHIDAFLMEDGTEGGGFARLKTAIDAVNAEHPNLLLVDAGDFSMGTLYQSVYETQAVELRLLGRLGFDATTFGNHEFDYGAEGVAHMLSAAKNSGDALPAFLTSNIDWEQSPGPGTQALKDALETYGAKQTLVLEKGGVKIGLFGLLGEDAEECAPNSGLAFEEMETAAKTAVAALQAQGVDMIVCLSHGGTNADPEKSEDERLARAVPEIDVIISGHTHTTLPEAVQAGDTWIVSSGCYGSRLGTLFLSQKADGRWEKTGYTLTPLDAAVPQDPEILEAVANYRDLIQPYLNRFGYESADQVLAYSPYTYPSVGEMGDVQAEQPMGNLIADSYLYAVEQAEGADYIPVDVAVVPIGVIRAVFQEGPVTVADVYEAASLGVGRDGLSGYPLVSVYLTGAELETMAEVDASVSLLMPAAQLYCSGINYRFNPNRVLLNRVTEVTLADGTPLEKDRLYRVVADLYSGHMLGAVEGKSFGLLKLTPKHADGTPMTNFYDGVVYGPDGEVKQWAALASYLRSFEKNDRGIPEIPDTYGRTLGRKRIDTEKNPVELLKNPNKISFLLYGLILVCIAAAVLLVHGVRRRKRRKRA